MSTFRIKSVFYLFILFQSFFFLADRINSLHLCAVTLCRAVYVLLYFFVQQFFTSTLCCYFRWLINDIFAMKQKLTTIINGSRNLMVLFGSINTLSYSDNLNTDPLYTLVIFHQKKKKKLTEKMILHN